MIQVSHIEARKSKFFPNFVAIGRIGGILSRWIIFKKNRAPLGLLVGGGRLLGIIFHVIRNLLGGGFKYFLFSPRTLGKWSNLTHIFQTGWLNHQLVYILGKSLELSNLYLFSPLKNSLEFLFFNYQNKTH